MFDTDFQIAFLDKLSEKHNLSISKIQLRLDSLKKPLKETFCVSKQLRFSIARVYDPNESIQIEQLSPDKTTKLLNSWQITRVPS